MAYTYLNGLIRAEVVLVKGLQPAAVIVRMGHDVHIQHVISPTSNRSWAKRLNAEC